VQTRIVIDADASVPPNLPCACLHAQLRVSVLHAMGSRESFRRERQAFVSTQTAEIEELDSNIPTTGS